GERENFFSREKKFSLSPRIISPYQEQSFLLNKTNISVAKNDFMLYNIKGMNITSTIKTQTGDDYV
ncbi:MAG: hypothetical protein IJC21_07100, partial [Lentisphaeria bacterium]|nr:hypothetical protein [Lentisphaeria bacterium]